MKELFLGALHQGIVRRADQAERRAHLAAVGAQSQRHRSGRGHSAIERCHRHTSRCAENSPCGRTSPNRARRRSAFGASSVSAEPPRGGKAARKALGTGSRDSGPTRSSSAGSPSTKARQIETFRPYLRIEHVLKRPTLSRHIRKPKSANAPKRTGARSDGGGSANWPAGRSSRILPDQCMRERETGLTSHGDTPTLTGQSHRRRPVR